VYGDHQGAVVDETTVPIPMNDNGRILLETENVFLAAPCKAAVFRLGEIIGPGRQIVDRLRKLQGRPLRGNGQNYMNLIQLDDIVRALDFGLREGLQGIYNLCSDEHERRCDYYRKVCEANNLPPIVWDNQPNFHTGNKIVSNEKLLAAGFC
jgi:nucleoside-diphosphate-sugar epimerase